MRGQIPCLRTCQLLNWAFAPIITVKILRPMKQQMAPRRPPDMQRHKPYEAMNSGLLPLSIRVISGFTMTRGKLSQLISYCLKSPLAITNAWVQGCRCFPPRHVDGCKAMPPATISRKLISQNEVHNGLQHFISDNCNVT